MLNLPDSQKLLSQGLAAIAAFGFGFGSGLATALASKIDTPLLDDQPSIALCHSNITLQSYKRLAINAPLKEVEFILGVGIEEQRSAEQTIFHWKNADDSYIRGVFVNDILKSRSQQGLEKHQSSGLSC